MPRRILTDTCPPGIWCLSPVNGFLGVLCVLLFIGLVSYILQSKRIEAPYPRESPKETTIIVPPSTVGGGGDSSAIARALSVASSWGGGGDDRYTRSPQPQRFWNNGPEIPPRGGLIPADGGIFTERAINIPTQGFPENYQWKSVV